MTWWGKNVCLKPNYYLLFDQNFNKTSLVETYTKSDKKSFGVRKEIFTFNFVLNLKNLQILVAPIDISWNWLKYIKKGFSSGHKVDTPQGRLFITKTRHIASRFYLGKR